jgi:hypothetical protein
MAKLKLSTIPDDKPVRLTIKLPRSVHQDLIAYGELIGNGTGQVVEPRNLIPPMLARFIGTDRAFLKARREKQGTK